MSELIAIHARAGSFSDRWVDYCRENGLRYRLVDCHASDIISRLSECSHLLWHFSHSRADDMLVARAVILSAEAMGLKVFPDHATCWHFDDKLGQKYLLEAVGAPCIPTHVFVDEARALEWVDQTSFPKVFKLRGGAASSNVRLAKTPAEARRLVRRAFRSGFAPVSRFQPLRERWWQFQRDKTLRAFLDIGRGLGRVLAMNPALARLPRQKGYVYFQDFMPGNEHDVRIVVVGKRAFGIKRMNREGDFRASGSGLSSLNPADIPSSCIAAAFGVADRIGSQSLAMDFIFSDGAPVVVEVSYAFVTRNYPGYWTRDLAWVATPVRIEDLILENLLASGVQEE